MNWRVVTVCREFGCGSSAIARSLADVLGWRLFDAELIEEIARRANLDPSACRHADERLDSWLQRIGKNIWNSGGEAGPSPAPLTDISAERMAALTHQAIRDIAGAGKCVIVGRGGNYVLRGQPDVFHVFFYAPRHWRVRRLIGEGRSEEQAAVLIERSDRDRAAYIRRYFDEEWPRRHFYHLLLNASLGPERAIAIVKAAML